MAPTDSPHSLKIQLPTSPAPYQQEWSEYQGVQHREEVLRYIREKGPNIIDLDSDCGLEKPLTQTSRTVSPAISVHLPQHDLCVESTQDALPFSKRMLGEDLIDDDRAKRRKLHDLDGCINFEQIHDQRFGPDSSVSLVPQESHRATPEHPIEKTQPKSTITQSKDRSTSGRPQISKSSDRDKDGLESLQDKATSSGDHPDPSSFMFEDRQFEVSQPSHEILETSSDVQVRRAKKAEETASIAYSQRLRASRDELKNKPRITPADKELGIIPGVGTREYVQQTRERHPQNPSRNEATEDTEEMDRQFDMLMTYERTRGTSPTAINKSQRNPCPQQNHSERPNAFSRQAAEQYRTQSRHLDHSVASSRSLRPASLRIKPMNGINDSDDTEKAKSERERLMLARATARDHRPGKFLNAKFYGVDLEKSSRKSSAKSKAKTRTLNPKEKQGELRKLMNTGKHQRTPQQDNSTNASTDNGGVRCSPTRNTVPSMSISTLSQLRCSSSVAANGCLPEGPTVMDPFETLPEQGNWKDLSLPKIFDRLSEEEKALFVERQIKTERREDLDLISEIFLLGAQLAAMKDFDPKEPKIRRHLTDLGKFADAVCLRERSGKPVRGRIKNIRSTFKRWLESKDEQPDAAIIDRRLGDILQKDIFEKLQSELPSLENRLSFLKIECDDIARQAYSKSKRISKSKVHNVDAIKLSKATCAAKSSDEERLAILRHNLSKIEKKHQGQFFDYDDDQKQEVVDLGQSQDYGSISEEDEGEEFSRPRLNRGGLTVQQDVSAAKQQADSFQTEKQEHPQSNNNKHRGTQIADSKLLSDMLVKQQQQDHLLMQGVQKQDSQISQSIRTQRAEAAATTKPKFTFDDSVDTMDCENGSEADVEEDHGSEFDDSDIEDDYGEDSGAEDENCKVSCKRYIVKAICSGLSIVHEESEYHLGKYLDRNKARNKVLSFAIWVKSKLARYRPELKETGLKESTSEMKDSCEQSVTFGELNPVISRAWFEQELYNPSEEAYQKAKVYKACQPPELWFVDWERTVKPYGEPREDETQSEQSQGEVEDMHIPSENVSQDSGQDQTRVSLTIGLGEIADGENAQHEDLDESSRGPVQTTPDTDAVVMAHPPVPGAPKTSTSNPTTEDEDEDLFGPEDPEPIHIPAVPPTPPSTIQSVSHNAPRSRTSSIPTPQTIVTRATGDHIRFFSCRALANRHAKQVFMRWYIDRLPGYKNQRFIEYEDEMMEAELQRMGDLSCWSRQEDFVETNDEGEKVVDELKVWVRKGKTYGPSN